MLEFESASRVERLGKLSPIKIHKEPTFLGSRLTYFLLFWTEVGKEKAILPSTPADTFPLGQVRKSDSGEQADPVEPRRTQP